MEKCKRYFVFLIGLFINSLGVSLITKANLGTSPISSIPYVLSLSYDFSLGEFTIGFSILLILLQLLILRRNFKLEHLLQIPISIIFGYFIDMTMEMLTFVVPINYVFSLLYLFIGCFVLAIGVYTEVLANVAMLPGESFVRAISMTWKTEFGSTKVAFDVTITLIAAFLSFVLEHRLNGVREGSVIAAIFVGFIARYIGRKTEFLKDFLFSNEKKTVSSELNPSLEIGTLPVIVIDRQYGSGGHEIGEMLAKELGFDFYDNEIIKMTAGSTGYAPEFIETKEENITSGILSDFKNQMYVYPDVQESPQDEVFESEKKVIESLAQKGNCVIVGRCADYVLRKRANTLKLFFYAPIAYRTKRIMCQDELNEQKALQKISKIDKHRSEYYNYYTNQIWGNAQNYTISLDTSIDRQSILSIVSIMLKCI